jgi:hypothetical protein
VFNGTNDDDLLYCLSDNKEISVCWEIGKTRDGNGYKPAGFCRPKPVPVKNIYTH